MSLYPARDEQERKNRRNKIELCGKNMGPHQYIPIEWLVKDNLKQVNRLLCRVCFCNVSIITLLKNYEDVSYIE